MKRFILFNLLVLIATCPVMATPTIAYESMSMQGNNVLDGLWWEGSKSSIIKWRHQPTAFVPPGQSSLHASINSIHLGSSVSQNSRYKKNFWSKGRAIGFRYNKPPDFAPANGWQNGAAVNGVTQLNVNALDGGGYSAPVATPAPGAILLGSIGVGFVGWLHRRESI